MRPERPLLKVGLVDHELDALLCRGSVMAVRDGHSMVVFLMVANSRYEGEK